MFSPSSTARGDPEYRLAGPDPSPGSLLPEKAIKLDPATSVLGHADGDEIRLTEADFVRLSTAFFSEIEEKYAESRRGACAARGAKLTPR